jgi:hypothetical protein
MPLKAGIREVLEQYMYEKKINKSQRAEKLEIPNATLNEIINGKKKLASPLPGNFIKNLILTGIFFWKWHDRPKSSIYSMTMRVAIF